MAEVDFKEQVEAGKRFQFGDNWKQFLQNLNEERISAAEQSLKDRLECDSLSGKTFLDIGSGSGLFSLAARNLGATVHSIDFDPSSVWCTNSLKDRYYPNDSDWRIEEGSALDNAYLDNLGKFDIVYSWGVLHHTGEMWTAIVNASERVATDGTLYIAIYNDQGFLSHAWWMVKYVYNKLPSFLKKPYAYTFYFSVKAAILLKYTIKLQPMTILGPMFKYRSTRGMKRSIDIIDWYGGFPFEFARYDSLVKFLSVLGYTHVNGIENKKLGCHEIVFKKNSGS